MFNLRKVIFKLHKNSVQTLTRLSNYSTAKTTLQSSLEIADSNGEAAAVSINNPVANKPKHDITKANVPRRQPLHSSSPMVAAVFASLQNTTVPNVDEGEIKTPFTDERITKSTTINELLSISEGTGVSRRHAMKVISVLAEWSSSGKIKLSEVESDPRFLRLCRILTRAPNNQRMYAPRNNGNGLRGDDLSTVLGVTADDEAAKLIASITLPQMVKVMSTLSLRKRRSTPLLRSLSFNISRSSEKLDLKQCADLLYSMSVLNFPDAILLERISSDLSEGLEKNKDKSAVIGSILTSLGLLRYHSSDMLESLCDWVYKHHDCCRPHDIFALLLTLAVVNYQPPNAEQLFSLIVPQLNQSDAQKSSTWIDVVWSLVLMSKATPEHVASILSPQFISKVEAEKSISPLSKLKVLHINTAAKLLISNYNGPFLDESSILNTTSVLRVKEKEALVTCLLDTLSTLLPATSYFRTNIDNGWGFLTDAECVFDAKFNPIAFSTMGNDKVAKTIRVAILVNDYGDMCRGRLMPTGVLTFSAKVLEKRGYKVLNIPFTEFDRREKLIKRVQYLETKLKEVVKNV